MTAASLVANLQARGLTLEARGDKLHVRPTGLVRPDELEALRARKAEVLALVRPSSRTWLEALSADTPCVYVDFAGNGALRKAIHTRFTKLAYSCSIGGTHVQRLAGARDLPGAKATLFFAPAQVKKRSTDWGPAEFGQRLVAVWHGFRAGQQPGRAGAGGADPCRRRGGAGRLCAGAGRPGRSAAGAHAVVRPGHLSGAGPAVISAGA